MPQLLPFYYTYNIVIILVVFIVITIYYSNIILPYIGMYNLSTTILIVAS